MPSDKDNDEALTTPLEDSQGTTPSKTLPASGETPPELPASSLHALRQRYDVLEELGRGGMGIVYKARGRETGEIVALKVLKSEVAAYPEILERFKSELRLARKITHKSVCRTHELLRFGSTVVIAMEFVEGESLRRQQGNDSLGNLVTLCAYCHTAEHGQLGYQKGGVDIFTPSLSPVMIDI